MTTNETSSRSAAINPADVDNAAARLERRPAPAFTPLRSDLSCSFEFFPPATDSAEETLHNTVTALAPLDPTFVSVTYGAGGSTQQKTLASIRHIAQTTSLNVAGHLTCVGKSQAEVDATVDEYQQLGVNHIVALRGDPPADSDGRHPDGYETAADLVAGIRRRSDIDISVAAYPEVHPKAPSAQADMDNLKAKVDAGATQVITQFFFDADVFLDFFERARAAGITVPIIPGIMPITHFKRVSGFAARCGTVVPTGLAELFDGLDDAPEIRSLVAATVAAEQCQRLVENGIRQFHFYTMNRPELTAATCRILGIRPKTNGSSATKDHAAAS